MGFLGSGYEGSGGHLGPVREVVLEGHSEAILGPILDPILGNLINILRLAFIRPWVGPRPQNMVKYGSWDEGGWVPV